MGQRPIPLGILRQIAVKKIDGHREISRPGDTVHPSSESHRSAFDSDRNPLWQLGKKIIHGPIHRLFDLTPGAIEPLVKVALPMQQSYRYHRQLEIGCGSDRIAGEHTETAAVSRHLRHETDLHGKISDGSVVQCCHDKSSLTPAPELGLMLCIRRNAEPVNTGEILYAG